MKKRDLQQLKNDGLGEVADYIEQLELGIKHAMIVMYDIDAHGQRTHHPLYKSIDELDSQIS